VKAVLQYIINFYNRLRTKKADKLVFVYNFINMSVNVHEFDKLVASVLWFQYIFHFAYQYWCYEIICLQGYCINQRNF